MKYQKLNEIKKMRSIRDEILTCDNAGRLRKLIVSFDNIRLYDYRSGGMRESCITVRLDNGYEFTEYSDGIIINDNCLEKMGLFLYHLWRDYIRKGKQYSKLKQ